jgi:hypothetical protein
VSGEGAAINAATLAELCVGDEDPGSVADRVRSWGVELLDIPTGIADRCATAFRLYLERRSTQTDREAPATPLPDFFIGAHAEVMFWELATADEGRFKSHFPSVQLRTP